MRRPEFFIVGAPKCGTTALHALLREHPDLFLPKFECNHFGNDLHIIAGQRMPLEQYVDLFQNASPTQLCGEKSVFYLVSRSAAKEIRAFATDPKIIVMLRDPVEMMYALHSQLVYTGHEPLLRFEDALEAEHARSRGSCLPPNGWWREVYEYRRLASYAGQIEHYFNTFGRDRVLVVIQEEFQEKPAEEYQQVLAFLEISSEFSPKFRRINVNRRIIAPRLYRALWRPPKAFLKASRFFPVTMRQNLVESVRRRLVYDAPRPSMNVDTKAILRDEFRKEINHLNELLHRKLPWHQDHQ